MRAATVCLFVLGLSSPAFADEPPSPAALAETAAADQINAAVDKQLPLRALNAGRDFLKAYPEYKSSLVSAYLRAVYAQVGLYREALELVDRREKIQDNSSRDSIAQLTRRSALDTLEGMARDSRLLMINEAHHIPQDRAFAAALLVRLKNAGFTHFAAETLDGSKQGLMERGYPTYDTGYYSIEPLYGDLIRTALRLGFKVVAYEPAANSGDENREELMAKNLMERVFHADPTARLVVYAGYGHIDESRPAEKIKTLAQRLRIATGIDPLTINQARMSEHSSPQLEYAAYRYAADELKITEPSVFVGSDGKAWSYEPQYYDVSVFLPRSVYKNGRPDWLKMHGARRNLKLGRTICGAQPQCLVSARYANESKDSVPIDQLAIDAGAGLPPDLLLPKGDFVLTVTDVDGNTLLAFEAKR